jgi:hypothetical protein
VQQLLSTGDTYRGNGPGTGDLAVFALLNDDPGNNYFDDVYIDGSGTNLADPTSSIPEPATMSLLGLGLVGLIARRRASK